MRGPILFSIPSEMRTDLSTGIPFQRSDPKWEWFSDLKWPATHFLAELQSLKVMGEQVEVMPAPPPAPQLHACPVLGTFHAPPFNNCRNVAHLTLCALAFPCTLEGVLINQSNFQSGELAEKWLAPYICLFPGLQLSWAVQRVQGLTWVKSIFVWQKWGPDCKTQ